ncbi:LOW QUALITY PROTEIN: olfactory receptor 10Q1-like [Rhynchonycteris naso]
MFARSPVLNQSGPTDALPEFQVLLFLLFLLLYLLILCGNTAIIWTMCTHSSLRTPMYFFLFNLSFIEISYTTVVVPLMLSNIFGDRKPISLAGCGTQMFFFLTLGGADCFLLAIMAYDRYVAICHPLHYTLIMTQKLCIQMVACAVVLALYLSLQLTSLIFTLPFCGHLPEINPFLCDVPPVLRLACADIRMHQAVLYVVSILVLTVPFILISVSYVFITLAILRIRSAEAHRAFSTCSSHLTVVLLHYGFCALVYLRPHPAPRWMRTIHYDIYCTQINIFCYCFRYKCIANHSLFDALISFTSCILTDRLHFLLFFLARDPSELKCTDKALTRRASRARVWKTACGPPQHCLHEPAMLATSGSLVLLPSQHFVTSSGLLL